MKILICAILTGFIFPLFSQDLRCDMYEFNAFGTNPALLAYQSKAGLSYQSRQQKLATTPNHHTLMLSGFYPIFRQHQHYATVGMSAFRDSQGNGGHVTGLEVVAAAKIELCQTRKIYLALGMQGGSREWKDNLRGTEYRLGWAGGTIFYQNHQEKDYQKKWFLGISGSNWIGRDRYMENYFFENTQRLILIAGFQLWANDKYSFVPNVRSILQNGIDFTNYGVSVRKHFNSNSGTLFRGGAWGLSVWQSPNKATIIGIDIDTPSITMGFSYSLASQKHLFSYQNAREFVVTLKKSIQKKKKEIKPIINEFEPEL